MKVFKDAEICLVLFVVGMALAVGIWGFVGDWFPPSLQEMAERRGITIGSLGRRNDDGSFYVIFDNECVGKKYLIIHSEKFWQMTDFIEDDRDFVKLIFDPMGRRGLEKLTDEELVRQYLKRVEIHYRRA